MASAQARDFELRIAHLRTILSEAINLLDDEEATTYNLLRYSKRLPVVIFELEKFRPTGEEAQKLSEDALEFSERAAPLLCASSDILCDLQARLEIAATTVTSKAQVVTPPTPAPTEANRYAPRHLEVKIPTFTGEYAQYTEFIQSFHVATNFPNVSKAHKFLVLKAHLGPKPLLLLSGHEPSDSAYDSAMASLEHTYNQPARIIASWHDKLVSLSPAQDNANSLRETYMKVESYLRAMESHAVRVNEDETIRRLVLRKYPHRIRQAISTTESITLALMRRRIDEIVTIEEDVENIVGLSASLGPVADVPAAVTPAPVSAAAFVVARQPLKSSTTTTVSETHDAEKLICAFCKGAHTPSECKIHDTATKRRDALPAGSCFSCLKPGHTSKYCRSRQQCTFCGRRSHHPSFCRDKFGAFIQPSASSVSASVPATAVAITSTEASSATSQLKEEPRTVHLALNEKGTHLVARAPIRNPITRDQMHVRFLLDCGSNGTYLSSQHASDLHLRPIESKQLLVTVFLREQAEKIDADAVHFELLSDHDPAFRLDVIADTIKQLPSVQSYDLDEFRSDFPQHAHYQFADPANAEPIGVVLGNDYLWHLLKTEQKVAVSDSLFLVNSVFGWLIVGRAPKAKFNNTNAITCVGVQESLEMLWSLDSLGIREPNYSKEREEQLALTQFYEKLQFDDTTQRYVVPWPWRSHPPPLPSNFGLAKGRMLSLLRKYAKSTEYLDVVDSIFQQQLQDGIIELVSDVNKENSTHYLPFQLVVNDTKSTPVRVVYDGSAKVRKAEPSINECLFKGVNLLADLLGTLLRFRLHAVAIAADIEKAFLQIDLHENERDYLRFFWVDPAARQKGEIRIVIFRFRRVPFGIISSPFILAAVIVHHLRTNVTKFSELIIQNLYVDNLIVSVPTPAIAQELITSTVDSFKKASMNMRSWVSNYAQVTNQLPDSLRDQRSVIGVLGLQWNCSSDTLSLSTDFAPNLEQPTMRQVLKDAAKIFDPLGWCTPVTIRAKLLLQRLHHRKCTWDGHLQVDEMQEWRNIAYELGLLNQLVLARHIGGPVAATYRFQCFADASKHVYAAAVYLQYADSTPMLHHERPNVHLLLSKARVTPLRFDDRLTIPQLELMGALIAVRLLLSARKALHLPENNTAIVWIDSKCVLYWLHTRNTLPTFVGNRVAEIVATPNVEFRYLPSSSNIADLPTRACSASALLDNTEWWHGPAWLSSPEKFWPPSTSANYALPPETEEQLVSAQSRLAVPAVAQLPYVPFDIDSALYHSFDRLIRVTAIAVRFTRNLLQKARIPIMPFDANTSSFQCAQLMWIRAVQKNHFGDLHEYLRNTALIRPSLVRQLRPTIDDRGIIRCSGRFANAPIPDTAKFPVLLPKPTLDRYTFLLVLKEHTILMQAGTQHTLASLRQRVWFSRGRQ